MHKDLTFTGSDFLETNITQKAAYKVIYYNFQSISGRCFVHTALDVRCKTNYCKYNMAINAYLDHIYLWYYDQLAMKAMKIIELYYNHIFKILKTFCIVNTLLRTMVVFIESKE